MNLVERCLDNRVFDILTFQYKIPRLIMNKLIDKIILENKLEKNKVSDPKKHIIEVFNKKIKGKEISLDTYNKKHCGKEGHWLEKQMGISHNSYNEPDINGFEMKKNSKKITLGDFSASEYCFSRDRKKINLLNNWTNDIQITRNQFIQLFGEPNTKKNNRYSWSGKCVPTYNEWNNCGQIILVNEQNDMIVKYSFSKDMRERKHNLPEFLKKDELTICFWDSAKLKTNVNRKFNQRGFFICKKIGNKYEKICFGKPFDFDFFINQFKHKKIKFDSGMYEGNNRNYSQFRTNSLFYDLITEEI